MRRVTQPDLNGNTYIDAHRLQPGDEITLTVPFTADDGTPVALTLNRVTVDSIENRRDEVTVNAYATRPAPGRPSPNATGDTGRDTYEITFPWNHPIQLTTGNQ